MAESTYKEKYKKLKTEYREKKKKKHMLQQIWVMAQNRCRTLNEEINHLLDLIMEIHTFTDSSESDSSSSVISTSSSSSKDELNTDTPITSKKMIKKEMNDNRSTIENNNKRKFDDDTITELNTNTLLSPKKKRKATRRDTRFDAKPMKLLPRDENNKLILPVTVGRSSNEVEICKIGKVVYDRDAYHSQRYIWPVGFESKKEYLSMLNPQGRTIYTNRILDGGDTPIFEVVADDIPDMIFRASSASGVWKKVLSELSRRGCSGAKTHASGPDFFGISDLGVTKVIQELPNAEKCSKYIQQRWIENENNNNEELDVDDEDDED